MLEIWRDVVGLSDYEVSNLGRVKSKQRRIHKRGRLCMHYEKIMKLREHTAGGYPLVEFKKDGKQVRRLVHTLVLEAFVGPRPKGYETRHLNGIKTDNRLSNLAWGTPSENGDDRIRLNEIPRGESSPTAKLTSQQVIEIRRRYGLGESQFELAKEFGVSQSNVSCIVRMKSRIKG